MAKQFRIGYVQAVIATRVAPAPAPKLPETTRNEFGVCVGLGHPSNNSVLVYFPSRGTNYVSIRFNVRVIKLGSKRQMSLEEGKGYLPTLGPDGQVHLISRGESTELGKAFAVEYN